MRRLFMILATVLLPAGCGNKMDLPVETSHGAIPYDGYFVAAVWEDMGDVTDILVTEKRWLYIAEDSASVTRYKSKGANEGGTIVARAIESVGGLDRPLYLDEGERNHIFILDRADTTLSVYSDRRPDTVYTILGVTPAVRHLDLYENRVTATWADPEWLPFDSTETLPGRDSTTIDRVRRTVEITSLAADRESHVFVSGVLHYSLEEVVREFEFIYQEGTDSLLSTEVIAADTTTVDSVLWFIRKYDADGNYLAETAGQGTGLGYGEGIEHIALSNDYLYFVDAPANRVKINDPEGESKGIEWLEGTEITDAEERFPFLLDPSGVAADLLGFLYVSDGGNGRVLRYDGSYQYAERVDRNGADLLAAPAAVAATDSLVYVFDRLDRKVVLFELPGPPE